MGGKNQASLSQPNEQPYHGIILSIATSTPMLRNRFRRRHAFAAELSAMHVVQSCFVELSILLNTFPSNHLLLMGGGSHRTHQREPMTHHPKWFAPARYIRVLDFEPLY